MLTEKLKKIAWDTFIDMQLDPKDALYAAVEAVLAEQARAGEQTDVKKVEAILSHALGYRDTAHNIVRDTAAEIVSALKAGNHD